MRMPCVLLITVFCVTVMAADQREFDSHWYDGNAEIASYVLKENRYGEIRLGTRVMVFVTEPMRLSTHIKPDVKLPVEQMISVIKLNDLRKFSTGIYDYSVMTSVFAATGKKQSFENMATMKVALSVQEWCGMVYDRYVRTPKNYEGQLFSYFESEGEGAYTITAAGVESEENLMIRIRELNGPLLPAGQTISLKLIPSRWIIRKMHKPTQVVNASLSKGLPTIRPTAIGSVLTNEFRWTIDTTTTSVIVEHAYPHRILSFAERDGSSGTFIASRRGPYWIEHGVKDLPLRKGLGLSPL